MDMKRLVAMVVAAGAALAAVAMPTKAELQKAQTMVNDVTAADVAALKAKSKTPAEVAAKHMELAGQAGSEAEKYLLLQAAFKLYAKAGDYDAAANVIEKLQAEITDYNPEVTVELCGAEFIRKMRENAPRLYALKENARRIVFYRKQLPIREAAVKKNPKDVQAQRKLAECYAELGDWPKALEVFVKAGGEFKKMSEGETSGKIPAQELGDFWWDYETKSDTPIYKLHAAELYRKALADDTFKGLARTRAEQRVKEVAVDLPLKRIGGGADASAKNGACEFKGVLPATQYVLLWKNVSLKEISQLQASLCGGFIPNDRVQSCYMKENGTRKTFQFQAIADGHIKCVGVELIQRDGDVHGRISYARYTKYASKDVDFDLNHGGKMDIAKTETDVGYAVKDLAIIDGETPSSRPAPLTFDLAKKKGDADVKKTEESGPVACYPREDFGGQLLSSNYTIIETTSGLFYSKFKDQLFSRQKPKHGADFAFEIKAKDKNAYFVLQLPESVLLAGLTVVNRQFCYGERDIPLCVWTSDDNVKWERIFFDETLKDDWRIDLANKNIRCKYLKFGRLPGVSAEPFHLARTLVYVKQTAAEKKTKK